jgi:S1-C subfamily serine protease
MSSTEQPSPTDKPDVRPSTPKRIKQKYFFLWIGGITAFLVVVVLVASFNVGMSQFKSEMNDHFGPGRPLWPHGVNPQTGAPEPGPSLPSASGAVPATPNIAAGAVPGASSATGVEQTYNHIAVLMNQVTVSLSMVGGVPGTFGSVIGSGFLVGGSYALTNFHVVENIPAIEATVYYPSKARYPAQVVQTDPAHDLALIKVQAPTELSAATLGNSDAVDAGDIVLAVGSPLGVGNTISTGIVSAAHKSITVGGRVYQDLLQTTTPIYLGSSGGPLVNLAGRVVGINTIIYSPHGNFTGISFAVPINRALPLLQQVMPAVAQAPTQNLKLAGGGCAVNPTAAGCFVPAAAPPGQALLAQPPYPQQPLAQPQFPQQPGLPAPGLAPGVPQWTMLHCPRCQMFHYQRCPVCRHRMVLDQTGTQLACPLGHATNLGQNRCPICGGPLMANVRTQPFSFA